MPAPSTAKPMGTGTTKETIAMPKTSTTRQDRLIDDGVCLTGDTRDELVQIMARLNRSHAALIEVLDEVESARRMVRQAATHTHGLGAVWDGLRCMRLVAPGGRVQAVREQAATLAVAS